MNSGVTNRQIFFILLLTLTTYSVVDISRAMAESAGTGGWLTVLATSVIFAVAAVVIVSVGRRFPGKMLFDYAQQLTGKIGGYAMTLYYIAYFLLISVFLVLQMSKILQLDFFPKTPVWAFMVLGIPVFCYIAYKGIPTVVRLFEIIGLLYIITAGIVHIIMTTQGEVEHILPLFNPDDIGRYASAVKLAIFPFLGIELLLILPMRKTNSKKVAFWSVIAIGLFYVLIIETCIMMLGINDIVNYKDSLIVAIRDLMLPFLDFFERADILFLTVGFWGVYLGISLVFTAIVEYVCRMLPGVGRVKIVIGLGIVAVTLCMIANTIDAFDMFVTEVGTYLGLVSSLLIPLILWVAARRKKHGA